MNFKEHPIFDDSAASDWLDLSDDADPLRPEIIPFAELIQVYRGHQQYLEQKVIDRIKGHLGEDGLACIYRNELLFAPVGHDGFKLYYEFFFRKTDGPSADSDYWWAIILCGNVFDDCFGPNRERHWNVIDLGWTVG
ncbi:MAG: hypothetical protein AAF333_12215 [Planctomycetota bacterium]